MQTINLDPSPILTFDLSKKDLGLINNDQSILTDIRLKFNSNLDQNINLNQSTPLVSSGSDLKVNMDIAIVNEQILNSTLSALSLFSELTSN